MKKMEIKPSRTASAIGIFGGIVGIVFVIGWIVTLLSLAREDGRLEPGVIFLLIFGVVFLIAIIASTVFYGRMTFAKKRPSLLDIEEVTDDEINAKESVETKITPNGEIKFCPYCGKTFKKDFLYCQYCVKKINS